MVTIRVTGPTHVLPDLGLTLHAGETVDVEPEFIPHVEGLQGVVLVVPSAPPAPEPDLSPETPATRKKAPAKTPEEN